MRVIKRGTQQAQCKFTDVQRDEIARRYYAGGTSHRKLGREFGVDDSTIREMVLQRRPNKLPKWPPEIPGLETPDFLLTARGSFPPDAVLERAREAMRKDFPLKRRKESA